MNYKIATLRFYAELNDFLAVDKRQCEFTYQFLQNPSIKDVIESLGVPHTEVDLILVNQNSVDFNYLLQAGDQVSIYPTFEAIDISDINHLRPAPLRDIKFVLDVHLGKLAKYLRILGFDVYYQNHLTDNEIIALSEKEQRIILTRDKGILKQSRVMHGFWIHQTDPELQIQEVVQRLQLYSLAKPFKRCLECNTVLRPIQKQMVLERLQPKTIQYFNKFQYCAVCDKIFWQGSHITKMKSMLQKLFQHKF